MIRKKQGAFLTVKKRSHLTEKEYAGELFQLLFSTYFRKINIGYGRHGVGTEFLQDTLPYSFYQLYQHANQWSSSKSLYEVILLPEVKLQLESRFNLPDYNPGIPTMVHTLLTPLVHFGVLEERETGEKGPYSSESFSEFRKTPLFDKVISFNIQ